LALVVELGTGEEIDTAVLDVDGLDVEGLAVEEHPVTNDAVITISPAITGIEIFISPTLHQRGERSTQMTQS